ncbi:MAG TPA: hypothetical protein VJR92_04640 [Gemmatimonadaceae bacterium]|nr:hypothetical protein [Gemmatimonadaceae bacterium]
MQSDELLEAPARKRLALLRTTAVVAPWIAAFVFAAVSYGISPVAPYADGFPSGARRLLTGCLFGSGVLSILVWVALRTPRSPRTLAAAMTACYVGALWVAVLGAAAWGRGAALGWFVMTYVWALAVVFALFPLGRR